MCGEPTALQPHGPLLIFSILYRVLKPGVNVGGFVSVSSPIWD